MNCSAALCVRPRDYRAYYGLAMVHQKKEQLNLAQVGYGSSWGDGRRAWGTIVALLMNIYISRWGLDRLRRVTVVEQSIINWSMLQLDIGKAIEINTQNSVLFCALSSILHAKVGWQVCFLRCDFGVSPWNKIETTVWNWSVRGMLLP